jgi:seipin
VLRLLSQIKLRRTQLTSQQNTALLPLRIAVSKPAQRAYLTSVLFFSTCFFLLIVSIAAYLAFYWSYIPRIGFSRPIHLQFDSLESPPWGVANLAPELVSLQPYDVKIQLRLPRTKTNTEIGNFMVETALFTPGEKGSVVDDSRIAVAKDPTTTKVLASSRRTAILTYYSPVVDLARKATELHWLILGWRLEAETLDIPVFTGVSFAKGWRNVPDTMQIQVQSSARMQIYEANVIFKARFQGLRWIMYNHRITSAFVFIGAFWGTEVLFTAICWAILSVWIFSSGDNTSAKTEADDHKRIKAEDSEDEEQAKLSDTERTYPTYSKGAPMRYTSPAIKKEETEPEPFPQLLTTALEADDENESDDFFDSGLGTSLESTGNTSSKEALRKRKNKASRG